MVKHVPKSGNLDRRDLITRRAQRRDQPLEMGAIAGFALDVEAEPLGRQIGEDALVRQFQNVDRLLIEDAGDMEQRAGPILQDDTQAGETSRTGEIAKVSSVSTNDLTVVRAQQGTSAAALLDNDYVLVLGEIIYEMDTVGIVRTTQPVTVFNYTEIFRKAHSISGTALATKKRTIADDVRDKKIALRNMRRDMEHAFRFGVKEQTGSGSTTQRHTGGFESYITTNVFQANGQVTEPFLLGVCKEIFTYGTATKKLVLAGPELMSQLAALGLLADTVISADDKDRNWLGMDIRQFISPFGVLDFVWDKALTKGYADRGHIIDIEHVRQTTLQGRELDYKRIEGRQSGDTTFLDGTIGEFLTERGFDLDNEPTCGVIKGTTLAS